MAGEKIVIGMSGGVDSSVAAYLLKEAGYQVYGVTMQTWDGREDVSEESHAGSILRDAKRVADFLSIPHSTVDFHKEFQTHVKDYFVGEYLAGRTPNPCVVCNHKVKWEALLSYGKTLGADLAATGHYAEVLALENGRYTLQNAGHGKDQTYALYRLSQEQLARTRMPLSGMDKEQVRALAKRLGIPVADKPDSQENCFIPDNDYAAYVRRHAGRAISQGDYVDKKGQVIGRHKGIIHYTVGQRKGLGLALGHPVFVTGICPEKEQVVIGESEDLFSRTLVCDQVNFMGIPSLEGEIPALAKIRYNHRGASCLVRPLEGNRLLCTFEEPQRAITPGQSAVFYRDGQILAGGRICG